MEDILGKVSVRKDGVKFVLVPKKCILQQGDYVLVKKVNREVVIK